MKLLKEALEALAFVAGFVLGFRVADWVLGRIAKDAD